MPGGHSHLASLVVLAWCIATAYGQEWNSSGPVLDPCAPLTNVNIGDSFTLGLLLWPGQNATAVNAWINNLNTAVTVSGGTFDGYCTPNVTEFLSTNLSAAFRPRWAVFSTRVDRLQLMQVPYSNIVLPMTDVPTGSPPTMVMVVFRAGIYSDAVYAASADPTFTHGKQSPSQGGVGFAQTLSLMASFETGTLKYLNWWGTNCDACGGVSSNLCIKQSIDANVYTCATALQQCTCSGLTPPIPAYACNYNNENFSSCNTGVQVAWVGTAANSAAFKTGPQIQRLNSLSIVSLFYTVLDYLQSLYSQTLSQITYSWGNITSESKQQQVDQGSSIIGR